MNASTRVLVAGLMTHLLAGSARAEEPGASIPQYKTLDPVLARASPEALRPACPASGVVAFSATGSGHLSEGGPSLLSYHSTITQEGGGWPSGGGTFIAPCAGLYVFNLSFVRQASPSPGGTADDVFVAIRHNGVSRGYAWSGEAEMERNTGVYTVTLVLQPGDHVQTFVSSDGDHRRYLSRYHFTGYLVRLLGQ